MMMMMMDVWIKFESVKSTDFVKNFDPPTSSNDCF